MVAITRNCLRPVEGFWHAHQDVLTLYEMSAQTVLNVRKLLTDRFEEIVEPEVRRRVLTISRSLAEGKGGRLAREIACLKRFVLENPYVRENALCEALIMECEQLLALRDNVDSCSRDEISSLMQLYQHPTMQLSMRNAYSSLADTLEARTVASANKPSVHFWSKDLTTVYGFLQRAYCKPSPLGLFSETTFWIDNTSVHEFTMLEPELFHFHEFVRRNIVQLGLRNPSLILSASPGLRIDDGALFFASLNKDKHIQRLSLDTLSEALCAHVLVNTPRISVQDFASVLLQSIDAADFEQCLHKFVLSGAVFIEFVAHSNESYFDVLTTLTDSLAGTPAADVASDLRERFRRAISYSIEDAATVLNHRRKVNADAARLATYSTSTNLKSDDFDSRLIRMDLASIRPKTPNRPVSILSRPGYSLGFDFLRIASNALDINRLHRENVATLVERLGVPYLSVIECLDAIYADSETLKDFPHRGIDDNDVVPNLLSKLVRVQDDVAGTVDYTCSKELIEEYQGTALVASNGVCVSILTENSNNSEVRWHLVSFYDNVLRVMGRFCKTPEIRSMLEFLVNQYSKTTDATLLNLCERTEFNANIRPGIGQMQVDLGYFFRDSGRDLIDVGALRVTREGLLIDANGMSYLTLDLDLQETSMRSRLYRLLSAYSVFTKPQVGSVLSRLDASRTMESAVFVFRGVQLSCVRFAHEIRLNGLIVLRKRLVFDVLPGDSKATVMSEWRWFVDYCRVNLGSTKFVIKVQRKPSAEKNVRHEKSIKPFVFVSGSWASFCHALDRLIIGGWFIVEPYIESTDQSGRTEEAIVTL